MKDKKISYLIIIVVVLLFVINTLIALVSYRNICKKEKPLIVNSQKAYVKDDKKYIVYNVYLYNIIKEVSNTNSI
ncbi:MAG: hypothetical protein RSB54_03100, partial [Bacilli bacterium]